jgi:hypothetical protein
MARSFDIVFDASEQTAEADLAMMDGPAREHVLESLAQLRDRDIFAFVPLPLRRDEGGAWVLVIIGDWRCICRWDDGSPALWRLGVDRGRLTLNRIVHKDYFQAALDRARKQIGD